MLQQRNLDFDHNMEFLFQLDSSDEQTAVIRRELDNRLKIADQLQRVRNGITKLNSIFRVLDMSCYMYGQKSILLYNTIHKIVEWGKNMQRTYNVRLCLCLFVHSPVNLVVNRVSDSLSREKGVFFLFLSFFFTNQIFNLLET